MTERQDESLGAKCSRQREKLQQRQGRREQAGVVKNRNKVSVAAAEKERLGDKVREEGRGQVTKGHGRRGKASQFYSTLRSFWRV
jgi:hypothetical protein